MPESTPIRASEAQKGITYRPADGPQAFVLFEGLTSGGVMLRHKGSFGKHEVEADFLLVEVGAGEEAQANGAVTPTAAPVDGLPSATPDLKAEGPMAPMGAEHVPEKDKLPMARGMIKRIQYTIKGGGDITLPARHTLVLGDNGAGKSALVNATELGALGGCSDIGGREWSSSPADLATLIDLTTQDKIMSRVDVVGADGREGTFQWLAKRASANKSGVTRGEHTFDGVKLVKDSDGPFPIALPLRGVLDELRGSPERAQAFLMSVACGLTEEEVLAHLPPAPEHQNRIKALLAQGTGSIVDRLLFAQTEIKTLVRTASKELKELEARIEEDGRNLEARPTEADTEEATHAVETALGEVNTLTAAWADFRARTTERAQASARVEAVQAQANVMFQQQEDHTTNVRAERLREIAARVEEIQNEAAVLQPLIDALPSQARVDYIKALRLISAVRVEAADDKCGACAGPLPAGEAAAIVHGADTMVEDWQMGLDASAKLARLQGEVNTLWAEKQRLEQAMAAPQSSTLSLAPPTPASAPEPMMSLSPLVEPSRTVDEAKEAYTASIAARDELVAIERQWVALDDLQKQARQKRITVRDLEYLSKSVGDLVADKVTDSARAFVQRVQKHLDREDRFWLDVSRGKYGLERPVAQCPICNRANLSADRKWVLAPHYAPGSIEETCSGSGEAGTNGHVRKDSALSGAEWARTTLALAAACTPAKLEVAVLIPEDRDWAQGGRTLKSAIKAMSNYPGQILFTTSTQPYRGVPKGWGVIVVAKDGTVLLNKQSPSGAEITEAMKKAVA